MLNNFFENFNIVLTEKIWFAGLSVFTFAPDFINNSNSLHAMITNFEIDKVFFARGLSSSIYYDVAKHLIDSLYDNKVAFDMLPETKSSLHIWARDYMPVQVSKDKIVQFRYEPDYLADTPEYKPDTDSILEALDINVIKTDIILDGGNVISCGAKVIMTDKIFKENPHYTKDTLIDRFTDLLEAEPILIPWDKYEEYGHADGMVRYMGEGRVLLNNYCDFDKSLRKKLLAALNPHFDVADLHYGSYTKNSWAYINFLHVGSHIFVPMLGERLDDVALQQIADAFSSCQCHPVHEWQHIVKHGGAINCTTWNILME